MNKKFFVFDMDGTLLDPNSTPLEENIKAIRQAKEKGHYVVIATGRPIQYISPIMDRYKLFDYYVCNNGSYVYKDGEFSNIHSIPSSVIDDIKRIGDKHQLNMYTHILGEVFGHGPNKARNDVEYGIGWGQLEIKTFEEVSKKIKGKDIIQTTLNGDKDDISAAFKDAADLYEKYNILVTADEFIDVNAKGVNKLEGIKPLIKKHNIDLSDVVAFGDSDNDYEIIKGVGLGFAMGNANEKVKSVANEVIGNNNTASIAKKVLELI